ncbi:protein rai1 [Elsinoe ampelina]|uniref:Decapping nuclease n=1 Tax=Elsinoe ampelina TaxID=302913 RepID=A0A6A6FYE2_9PEZI|nr:protein rai1 [Elsinoe ampelina]
MQEFRIDHTLDQRTKVNIKRPREIAYFSYDDQHNLKPFSTESLRYFYPAFFNVPHAPSPRPIDMSVGYQDLIYRDGSAADEHLDSLLDTLEVHERREGKHCEVDFVTWRGMMTKFVTAPFDKDGWEMFATKFQGTIYIEESFEHKLKRQPAGRKLDVGSYYGYKFETLSMLDHPMQEVSREDIESRPSRTVDTTAQYCSIVETAIGGHSMILGGEVDGVMGFKPPSPLDPPRWVELKTTREPTDPRGHRIFAEKLLKYWAQSFLIGCPTVAVGWRTQDGFLYRTIEMETQKIPAQAKASGHCYWNANVCLANAAGILGWLKENVHEGGVYRVWKQAKVERVCVRLETQMGGGTGEVVKGSFKEWRLSGGKGAGQGTEEGVV